MHISIPIFLIGIGLFVFGLYQSYLLIRRKRKINNSIAWPTISGIVTDTGIKYSSSKSGRHYYAEITYTYSVLGIPYNGIIRKESYWDSVDTANSIAATYPKGRSISVRYNPLKNNDHIVDIEEVTNYDIFKAAILVLVGIVFLIGSTFPSGK
jgi:hypothetical protein